MKKLRPVSLAALLFSGGLASGFAQTGSISPTLQPRTSDGRIVQPEKTVTPTDISTVNIRPDRVERALPPEIKAKVKQFEAAREAFITRQDDLRKKIDGATTDKERDEIRLRLKESVEQWREQARQYRDEARERAKDLQRELPKHREALEEYKGVNQGARGRRPGLD